MSDQLHRGAVAWVDLNPTLGREEAGTRPALVVASSAYLTAVRGLVIVVPVTTTDRHWAHHVRLTGARLTLDRPSFAMTEQPRTVSRTRLRGTAGSVDDRCMDAVSMWLRDFTAL